MVTPEIEEFIAKCRKINEARGEERFAVICGRIGKEPRVFADEEIEIVCCTKTQEMEILILPAIHPHNLDNPVVMIDEGGKIYRTHGEWVYARVKVDRLAREIENETSTG